MRTSGQAAWYSAIRRAAVCVALGAALGIAPRAAQAQCLGDCNTDDTVTVDEVVVMVNIALGSEDISACPAADPEGTGQVVITQIIEATNNDLNGCPGGEAVCGDGVTDSPDEECDNGGICIGGDNAGTTCTSETDCVGDGVCDTFGIPGGSVRKVCSSNADCGTATCIHCKTFGGDGCAANCTLESEITNTLVTGMLSGIDIVEGTSGAVVQGDILTIPLPLSGTNTFIIGKRRNGRIPISQKPAGVVLPRIPVQTLACACVRGIALKTCGGTQYEADGSTLSTDCTTDDSLCDGQKPCAFLAGPGNSGEGVLGCESLPWASYSTSQDAGGSSGVPGPLVFEIGAAGGPGAQVQATASAIGTVVGVCTGSSADYGPDGEFCTDDDPDSSRGEPAVQTLVTGTAEVSVFNANDIDGNDLPGQPFAFTGNPVSCDDAEAGNLSGGALAGAFVSLDQPTTGDIGVRNIFVTQ